MTDTVSISDARSNLPNLVTQVSNNLARIIITVNGKRKATLISSEELESLEETAEILSIPGAKASITRGLLQVKKKKGIPLSQLK